MARYNRREIMTRAWDLARPGEKFSDCLKTAWAEARLLNRAMKDQKLDLLGDILESKTKKEFA